MTSTTLACGTVYRSGASWQIGRQDRKVRSYGTSTRRFLSILSHEGSSWAGSGGSYEPIDDLHKDPSLHCQGRVDTAVRMRASAKAHRSPDVAFLGPGRREHILPFEAADGLQHLKMAWDDRQTESPPVPGHRQVNAVVLESFDTDVKASVLRSPVARMNSSQTWWVGWGKASMVLRQTFGSSITPPFGCSPNHSIALGGLFGSAWVRRAWFQTVRTCLRR